MHRAERGEQGAAEAAVRSLLGDEWLDDDPDLGEVTAIDGVQGRGAAGWIPVLEWIGDAAGQGLVGFTVASGVHAAVQRIRDKLKGARSNGRRMLVSRGLAAALAVDYVFEHTGETRVLDVEAADEPSAFGGRERSETSYTGLEPWIVILVTRDRAQRYLVGVSASGEVHGLVIMPMGAFDGMFGLLPPGDWTSPDAGA